MPCSPTLFCVILTLDSYPTSGSYHTGPLFWCAVWLPAHNDAPPAVPARRASGLGPASGTLGPELHDHAPGRGQPPAESVLHPRDLRRRGPLEMPVSAVLHLRKNSAVLCQAMQDRCCREPSDMPLSCLLHFRRSTVLCHSTVCITVLSHTMFREYYCSVLCQLMHKSKPQRGSTGSCLGLAICVWQDGGPAGCQTQQAGPISDCRRHSSGGRLLDRSRM